MTNGEVRPDWRPVDGRQARTPEARAEGRAQAKGWEAATRYAGGAHYRGVALPPVTGCPMEGSARP
jgi:hypothetical protein